MYNAKYEIGKTRSANREYQNVATLEAKFNFKQEANQTDLNKISSRITKSPIVKYFQGLGFKVLYHNPLNGLSGFEHQENGLKVKISLPNAGRFLFLNAYALAFNLCANIPRDIGLNLERFIDLDKLHDFILAERKDKKCEVE